MTTNKNTFKNVKVGDALRRLWEYKPGKVLEYKATVIEVTPTEIICSVMVDAPRVMRFDRATGININGDEYGWLEL